MASNPLGTSTGHAHLAQELHRVTLKLQFSEKTVEELTTRDYEHRVAADHLRNENNKLHARIKELEQSNKEWKQLFVDAVEKLAREHRKDDHRGTASTALDATEESDDSVVKIHDQDPDFAPSSPRSENSDLALTGCNYDEQTEDDGIIPIDDQEPRSTRASSEAAQPPMSEGHDPQPDHRSREELHKDKDFMRTLEFGTFASGGFIPAHHHIEKFPRYNWKDDSKPPPGSFKTRRGRGAWRCGGKHAWGDFYMGRNRKSCPGCGQSQDKELFERMSWDLSHDKKRRKGYVLFQRNTGQTHGILWGVPGTPKVVKTNGKHFKYAAARICELVHAQFPALSKEDLRPYWSRPAQLEDLNEAERLIDVLQKQHAERKTG